MTQEDPLYQELMRKTLVGDARAYEQLLRASAQLLRPFLHRFLRGNAETDDVLQEILLSLHKAKHTYDGNRPYKPWLFAIAKFRLQDYLRRAYANRLRHAVDLTTIENIIIDPVTKNQDGHELLEDGLRQLSGKQAAIVTMMHGEGYTAKEVGAKLGMKESAVKVAAHRAYKILREKLSRS